MTILYLGMETTGVNKEKDSIIRLVGTISSNGKTDNFDIRIRPYKSVFITDSVLNMLNYTKEELYSFPYYKESLNEFISILDEHIKKDNSQNRGFLVGWNAKFEEDFLRELFTFEDNNISFGDYFYYPCQDVSIISGYVLASRRYRMRNFKLETVYYELFGETLWDKDAKNLLEATKQIFWYVSKKVLPVFNEKQGL